MILFLDFGAQNASLCKSDRFNKRGLNGDFFSFPSRIRRLVNTDVKFLFRENETRIYRRQNTPLLQFQTSGYGVYVQRNMSSAPTHSATIGNRWTDFGGEDS